MCFDTPPLRTPVEILGFVRANLFVSSTAPLANWIVRVHDLAPDGTSYLVTRGFLNGCHRRSHTRPERLTPGEVYEIAVESMCTAYKFPAGHRIRVIVTNADFPVIWPSPHPMTTTLYTGGDRPSHVLLPVLPAQRYLPGTLPVLADSIQKLPQGERAGDTVADYQVTRNYVSGISSATFKLTRERIECRVNERNPAEASVNVTASAPHRAADGRSIETRAEGHPAQHDGPLPDGHGVHDPREREGGPHAEVEGRSPPRVHLAARGASPSSHRERRCARLARRDDRAYREYVRKEQRRQTGCSAARMQMELHRGLLGQIVVDVDRAREQNASVEVCDGEIPHAQGEVMLMHPRLVGVAVCLSVFVGLTPAEAQRTSGVIHGTVADASGGVVPGVTVTLRGVAVQGAPTTVTTETGTYRFPSVPPGTYALEFALSGFETLRREGIAISAADSVEVNVPMRLSALAETVTVSGASPVVDTSTAQLNTTYNREWVQNAPIPRTSIDVLLKAAPGVNPNQEARQSTMSVFGSGAAANIFQLDGNDYRNPNSNLQSASINPDMIEEIGVLSLGAPAEYGEVSGGVFNVITRRGSNAFHGDSSFYFQHQNLTDRNTTQAVDNGRPYQRVHFRDVTGQLGGPIQADKLWFFGSFQFQQDSDVQPAADPNFPAKLTSPRFFGKINAQFSTNHRVEGSYFHDYQDSVAAATAFQSPESVTKTNRHTFLPNVLWTSVLSPSTFIDARYTGSFVRVSLDPQIEGAPRIQPRYTDLTSGRITGGILYWADYTQSRQTASAKLSHYATDFLKGSHDLKVGVQYVRGITHWGPQGYNDVVYTYGGGALNRLFLGPVPLRRDT